MTVDSLGLVAIAAELRDAVLGRRLGEVVLPAHGQAVIGLPDGGLFISIRPDDARCHRVSAVPVRPGAETGLQAHLNALLRGGTVTRVEAIDFDRVLHLEVDNVDRVGRETHQRLVIELMGKHSACCVLDAAGLIEATLKTVTRAVNRHRELLPKLPYTPPPTGGRRDPRSLTRDELAALWPELTEPSLRDGWRRHLHGMSERLWQYLLAAGADQSAESCWRVWSELVERMRDGRFEPSLVRDAAGLPADAWALPLPGGEPAPSLSRAMELVAEAQSERQSLARRQADARTGLKRRRERAEALLANLARREQRAEQAAQWRLEADLILANLHRIGARDAELVVDGWPQEGESLTIALDPAMPPQRLAERLYERARKAARAAQSVAAERAAAEAELAEAIRALAALEAGEAPLPPPESAGPRERKPRTERERWLRRLKRWTTADGYTCLIGTNAAESEGLLSRVAAPTDLWFHVRGAGSGHVILRTEGRPEQVPPGSIEAAARLAARQSKMKHSDIVPVVYTQRKYVTKVTGGAAGKVVYRNEQTIFVDPTGG